MRAYIVLGFQVPSWTRADQLRRPMLGLRQFGGEQAAIVAGANLTGFALCCALKAQGVRARLFASEPPTASDLEDIVYLHPHALERLHAIGVLPRVLAHGRPLHALNVYASDSRIARVPLRVVRTPFPYILALPGSTLVRALVEHLADTNISPAPPVLVDWSQGSRGIHANIQAGSGRHQRVRARWLMQCQASHEHPSPGGCFLDATLDWDFPSDERYLFLHNGTACSVQAGPDRHRLFFATVPHPRDDLQRFVQAHIPFACHVRDLGPATPLPRLQPCPRLGDGPVFHVDTRGFFPAVLFGDRINAGIQRAFNLAWKIGLTKRGFARPQLLASYDAECRSVPKPVGATRLNEAILHMQDRARDSVRDCLAGLSRVLDGPHQPLLHALHSLAPSLGPSPLLDELHTPLLQTRWRASETTETASLRERRLFTQAPLAGTRSPDVAIVAGEPTLLERIAGPLHTLLLFDGYAPTPEGYRNLVSIARAVEARYGDLCRVHIVVPMARMPTALARESGRWGGSVIFDQDSKIHRRYGASAECLYLIRPDGFIGFRAQPAEESSLLEHFRGFLM